MGKRLLLQLFVSLALIVPIVCWIGGQHFFDILMGMDTKFLVIIFALYCGSLLLRGWRFRVVQETSVCGPNLAYILIAALHNAANQVMPFRSGELAFPFLSKRYFDRSMGHSVASLIFVRFVELMVLVCLVISGLLFLVRDSGSQNTKVLILSGMLLLMMLIWKILPRLLNVLSCVLIAMAGNGEGCLLGLLNKMANIVNAIKEELGRGKNVWVHLLVLSLTVANWLKLMGIYWSVLLSIGIHVSYVQTIVGSSVAAVAQFIPIGSLGNVGPLEAGWTLGFLLVGIEAKEALKAGIILHLIMIVYSIIIAACAWLLVILLPWTVMAKKESR